MQGVKRAKAKVLKFRRPISILCLRPNDLVREHEQRIHIVAAFLIRIPGNLDFQNRATDSGRKILLYHSQNLFHSPGFFTHARLALIVRQSVQATCIQVDPQTVAFASPSSEATILLNGGTLPSPGMDSKFVALVYLDTVEVWRSSRHGPTI